MKIETITASIIKLFKTKTSVVLISILISAGVSFLLVLEKLKDRVLSLDNLLPVTALTIITMVAVIFIVLDMLFGIIASLKENVNIQSQKWGYTIGKIGTTALFYLLGLILIIMFNSSYIVLTIVFVPLFLTILKEYLSIGENLERRYGRKFYLFSVVDKLFQLLETKFFSKLDNGSEPNIVDLPDDKYIDKDH